MQGSSVNALLMSSQEKGAEQKAVDKMKQFWLDAGNNKLYQNWWVGPWAALVSAAGVYDPSPFQTFLDKELSALNISGNTNLTRSLNIGLVDVLKGDYISFNEEKIGASS